MISYQNQVNEQGTISSRSNYVGLAVCNNIKQCDSQNATTNASNAVGNASTSVNQTASELGQNMSNAVGNAGQAANQTVSELGANASNAMNKTGEAVNATANELGKNASDAGSSLLNQTGEVAKKIIGGVGFVLGNISGEMKKP